MRDVPVGTSTQPYVGALSQPYVGTLTHSYVGARTPPSPPSCLRFNVRVFAIARVAALPPRSYVTTDLGALFEAAGLQPDTKYLCSATKTLSFRKPE